MIANYAQAEERERPRGSERDAALVARACRGDADAFHALFEQYQGIVYRIALRMVGNSEDAADLTQDTFIRAYRQLSSLRDAAFFGRWIRMIVTNICRDHLKRARPTIYSLDAPPPGEHDLTEWELPSPTENGEQLAMTEALKTALAHALAALSPDHRAVMILHHLEGLPVEEIALTMTVPVGTVKSRLARARADLRKRLDSFLTTE